MKKLLIILFLTLFIGKSYAEIHYTISDTINEYFFISKKYNDETWEMSFGLVDKNNKIILKYIYSNISIESDLIHINAKKSYNKNDYYLISGDKIEKVEAYYRNGDFIREKRGKKWRLIFLDHPERTTENIFDEVVKFSYSPGIKVRIGKKWGYYLENGKMVFETEYDNIRTAPSYQYNRNKYLILTKDKQQSLFTIYKQEIIPFGDLDISYPDFNRIKCYNKAIKKYGYYDTLGHIAIPFIFDDAENFVNDSLTSIAKEGSYYFIDKDGRIVSDKFDFIELEWNSNEFFIVHKNGFVGAISNNSDFDTLVPIKFKKIYGDYYGEFAVAEDFDKKKIVYPIYSDTHSIKYDEVEITDRYDGLTIETFSNGKAGILVYEYPSTLKELIPCECDKIIYYVEEISDEIAISCLKNGKYSFYSPNKQSRLLDGEYDGFEIIDNMDWIIFTKDGKDGLLNKYSYKWIIEPIYDIIVYDFELVDNYGWVPVYKGNKFSFYSIYQNTTVLPFKYTSFDFYDYETILIKENGKVGLMKNGQIVFEPTFDEIIELRYDYNESIMKVKMDGKKGFAFLKTIPDTNLKVPIFVEEYENLDDFYKIKQNGKWGVMGYDMNIVVPCEYDEIKSNYDGTFIVAKNNKYGLYLFDKGLTIPMEYDDLLYTYSYGVLKAQKNDKWGMINSKNEVIVDFTFKSADEVEE